MTPTRAPQPPAAAPATLLDFEPLLPAEAIVLRAAASGDIAKVSYRRPRTPEPDVKVRAEFLAFLAAGGGPGAPVAGRRLQVMGAGIVGRFALSGATLPLSLWLFRCTFDTAPALDGAHVMGHLSFGDCALPGLRAEDCRVDGDLALNAGCSLDGEVELGRAVIGRELDCERLHLSGPDDAARTWPRRFVADAIRVGGNVNLRGGAETVGEVRFVGARIGGDLLASGARLTADLDEAGARGVALNLDRAEIGGNVALDAGFSAGGAVRLKQARIGGDLLCSGADFDAVGDASWGENAAALLLERARIGGTLDLRRLATPLRGASLEDAQVTTLLDDASTWGAHHVLDGFTYRRLGAGAPTDATMRLDWLLRQRADQVDGNFRDDPWRRVIAALHDSGRGGSARLVAIGRERHLRRS
ncbi:MAG TPA: hypothetical protein VNU71_12770, partial [Burkholderiaceae bacterium]|nr:hypothetical protein [Burkholderiaceae bacterium]